MKKTIALACLGLVSISSGCKSNPGAAITAGAVATIFGVSIVAQSPPWKSDEEGIGPMVGTAGTALALVGAALVIGGVAGMAESSPEGGPSAMGLTMGSAPSANASANTSISAKAARPRASGAANEKLALHIRLAARANRCEAATFMMKELGERDYGLAQSLRLGDEHVARCATITPTITPTIAPAIAPGA